MRAPPISCAQTARTSGTPAATSASCSSAERITALERSEEHTSELQSRLHLVCRLLLEKKKNHFYLAAHEYEQSFRFRSRRLNVDSIDFAQNSSYLYFCFLLDSIDVMSCVVLVFVVLT